MAERHIVAMFSPKPEKVDKVRELLTKQAKAVQEKEDYCLRFIVTEQIENGNPQFTLFETYKDRDSITQHGQESHFKEMMQVISKEDLLKEKPFVAYTKTVGGFDAR